MRAALVQMTGSDAPDENLAAARAAVIAAASDGADLVVTPEVTNCVSTSRSHQNAVLSTEADDPTLAGLRETATDRGVWLLVGSLALKTGDADGRFANRSFLIAPDGAIAARYDKVHMFDVAVSETDVYRESDGFRPGDAAVLATTPFCTIGLSVCYDLRFPALYRTLAQAGAEVLSIPAAFTVPTGRAHWHVLLRARAIETGCFVLAPAQVGLHPAATGRPRETYGHSLAIDPWGTVLADAGDRPGVTLVDLDLGAVAAARKRVPSLTHDRPFSLAASLEP